MAPDPSARQRGGGIYHLVAVVLCGVVLIYGVRTTRDLEWPFDPDHLRDLAHAQTIQDGGWLKDPYYRGESTWYNPLLPGIVAAVSYVTARPIHVIGTRIGAYLNILSPLAFYLMVCRLVGPDVALACLVGFLFLVRGPTWASPTYSPWLFASISAQPLFYLTLAEYCTALRINRWWRYLTAGILLGATFLAHTAPAIIAAVTMFVVTGYQVVARKHRFGTSVRGLALIVVSAVLIGLPFLWSIVGQYHLRIQNPVPLIWRDPNLSADQWQTLWAMVSGRNFVNCMIVLGLAVVLLRRLPQYAAAIVLAWLGAGVSLFIYNHFLILRPAGISLPPIMPAHHFLAYERAAEMLLVGLGITIVATGIGWIAWRAIRVMLPGATVEPIASGAYALLIAAIVLYNYPAFLSRDAFGRERNAARVAFTAADVRAILPWIRANTSPSDVFLTSESACLSVIGPAGRKCVLAPRFFSNPYVNWEVRRSAHQAMWDSLASDDCAAFREHVYAYRVMYVMTVEGNTPRVPSERCGLYPTTFPGIDWRIYRVVPH